MADFKKAFALTMGNEGGFANNPYDTGGLTYKGISQKYNPNWDGWNAVKEAMRVSGEASKINALLSGNETVQRSVEAYYKKNYWDVNRLDEIAYPDIAIELFDTGVNCGVGTAARMLQESLNLLNVMAKLYQNIVVDGKIGPTTLNLTNQHQYPKAIVKVLNGLQFERYINIIRKDETQEIFFKSWLSRVIMV